VNEQDRQDQELVQALKGGDKASFEVLYMRYVSKIYRFIYYMVGSREEMAKDLTQEVFMRVYQKIYLYKPTGRFSSWVYKIAKNTTLKYIERDQHIRANVSLDVAPNENAQTLKESLTDADSSQNPAQVLLTQEQEALVYSALLRLKETDREVIVLCDLNEMPHREAAEIIGCTLNNVDVKLHRARLRLADIMRIEK